MFGGFGMGGAQGGSAGSGGEFGGGFGMGGAGGFGGFGMGGAGGFGATENEEVAEENTGESEETTETTNMFGGMGLGGFGGAGGGAGNANQGMDIMGMMGGFGGNGAKGGTGGGGGGLGGMDLMGGIGGMIQAFTVFIQKDIELKQLKKEAKKLTDPAALHQNALRQQALELEMQQEEDKQVHTWFSWGVGSDKDSTFDSSLGQTMDKSQHVPDHLQGDDYRAQLGYYIDVATKVHPEFSTYITNFFLEKKEGEEGGEEGGEGEGEEGGEGEPKEGEGETKEEAHGGDDDIGDEGDVFDVRVMVGPVKTQARCLEKMSQLYEEHQKDPKKEPPPHAARIFDYLRVTVIATALWRLQQCYEKTVKELKVLRVKNRLTTPGDGNKCLLLNFEYETPHGNLISEIQFTTTKIFKMNKGAHKYYESVRSAEATSSPATIQHYT